MVIYLSTSSWSPDVSSSYRLDLSLWRGAQMQSEHPDRLWAVSCEKILSVRGLSLFLSDHYNSVCMCTCPWDVLYSRLYKHSVPFFFKGTTEIGWLLSSPVCTFSADADVGFHGNVTRDGEWEASMAPHLIIPWNPHYVSSSLITETYAGLHAAHVALVRSVRRDADSDLAHGLK